MEIVMNRNGSEMTLSLTGRLDTTTAPQLENVVKKVMDGVETLTFDFSSLDYISSAGLRVLLATQKIMQKRRGMMLHHVKEEIMEVFEITGFSNILTIE